MREDQFIKLSLTGENAQIEYPKNPLLVRVFHELSWVEDMGSGTRNILRYAPLYFVISKLVYLFTYLPFQTVALVPVGDDTADDVLAGHHIGPSFGIEQNQRSFHEGVRTCQARINRSVLMASSRLTTSLAM